MLICILSLLAAGIGFADEDFKPGDRFEINSKVPKYRAAMMCLDASGKAWPSFLTGKPEDGGFWVHDPQNLKGKFEFHFTEIAQNSGDQSRRILGESVVDGETDFKLRLVSVGSPREITVDFEDNLEPVKVGKNSPDGTKKVERIPAVLELELRGVKTEVPAELRVKSGGKTAAAFDVFFRVEAGKLGIKNHTGEVAMRLWFKAFPEKK